MSFTEKVLHPRSPETKTARAPHGPSQEAIHGAFSGLSGLLTLLYSYNFLKICVSDLRAFAAYQAPGVGVGA